MKASEIMTRDVVTVSPDTSVAQAAAMMVDLRVSGFPVLDTDRKLCGMITEGDLLHRKEAGTEKRQRSQIMTFLMGDGPSAGDYITAHSHRVGDLMTTKVYTADENATLAQIVDLMEKRHIRRVPIVRDNEVLGMVSRLDVVRVLAKAISPAGPLSDAEIEQRLRIELDEQPWLAANSVSISVHDRTVTYEGFIFDMRCREALHVAAKSIAKGVKVNDKMVWADPNAGMLISA